MILSGVNPRSERQAFLVGTAMFNLAELAAKIEEKEF